MYAWTSPDTQDFLSAVVRSHYPHHSKKSAVEALNLTISSRMGERRAGLFNSCQLIHSPDDEAFKVPALIAVQSGGKTIMNHTVLIQDPSCCLGSLVPGRVGPADHI